MQEMNREQIALQPIEEEMRISFIDYAMSVIKGRALPDVRDGLKPVHRRIIYVMRELNLGPSRPYLKSARIVGDAMGKYHPHGDQAIYDALVRMVQDFSMRAPLIDGQGNFGSVDGDAPAAMRYTEARMAPICEELLRDIEKDTVDFEPNYDGKEQEPSVLPCTFPNLLVNGSEGIAVGMATKIPPHNLAEVVDALQLLLKNPEASTEELMRVLPGPDFPTGGFIHGRQGIREAYKTGRGKITVRGRVRTEQLKRGREAIVVTELPYQVNKARLVEEIAKLVRDKKLAGISEIRDESDRDGMRVVLELKTGEESQVIINNLFDQTQLQTTFGVILLALVGNRPRYLSLKQMLGYFLDHRREVIVRRTRFDLAKAEARLHVVEGLRIAVQHIDDVVQIIRRSDSTETARLKLMETFELSEIQANAILDMPLRRLTGLEREKLEEEHRDLTAQIKDFRHILDTPARVLEIIGQDLDEVRRKFANPRRTEIVDATTDLDIEDLIAEERMVITVSHAGYIKRTPAHQYRTQRRGGKGTAGGNMKEEDWVEHLFIGTTHDYIMFFTDHGKAYWVKVYELPQGGRATRGRPIVNLLQVEKEETIQAMIPVREFSENRYLVFVTAQGQVIRNSLDLYANPRQVGIKAARLNEGDRLRGVLMTEGQDYVFIATRKGMAVKFHEDDVRSMGRDVLGVRGINLAKDDEVVGVALARPGSTILSVCEHGYGKRSDVDEYRLTKRGGKGVINIRATERNGEVLGILSVIDSDQVMLISNSGMTVRSPISGIKTIGRATQGVRLITLKESDRLTGIARIEDNGEEADIPEGDIPEGEIPDEDIPGADIPDDNEPSI